jgi:WD40 repeat protein
MALIAVGSGNKMDLYDPALMKKCLDTKLLHNYTQGTHRCLAFNPQGTFLAAAVQYAENHLFDIVDGWTKFTASDVFGTGGLSCDFNPAGSLLAFTYDSTSPRFRVFNTSDWSEVSIAAAKPTSTCNSCAFSPNGQFLAVAGSTTTEPVWVYNTSDWSRVTIPAVDGSPTMRLAFSPDSSKLAIVYSGGVRLAVYETTTWTKLSGTPTLQANPLCCKFSNSGGMLVVSLSNSAPHVFAYNTSDWSSISIDPAHSFVDDFVFSPDDTALHMARNSSTLRYTAFNTTVSPWALNTTPVNEQPESLVTSSRAIAYSPGTLSTLTVGTTALDPVRDEAGLATVATARLYDRASGALMGQTITDVDGSYLFEPIVRDHEVNVVFIDPDGGQLNNDLIVRAFPG